MALITTASDTFSKVMQRRSLVVATHDQKSHMIFFRSLCLALLLVSPFAQRGLADAPVYFSADGAAIRGYDAVAYFTENRAVRGRADIKVEWKGAVWWFATERNRETFERNPRAFAPQYGGYCAYALSKGYLAGPDPTAWKIVADKLYLVHSKALFLVWSRNIPANIALSEANWPETLSR